MGDLLLDALALLPAQELAGIAKNAEAEGQALKDTGDPWGIVVGLVGQAAEFTMIRKQLLQASV